MDPGSPEHQTCLSELVRRYLYPHPNYTFARQGVYRIPPKGIARADE